MNNPLENFKNPFDIDGSFAQKILNTDRIFGNTNKILGIPNEEQTQQEENFDDDLEKNNHGTPIYDFKGNFLGTYGAEPFGEILLMHPNNYNRILKYKKGKIDKTTAYGLAKSINNYITHIESPYDMVDFVSKIITNEIKRYKIDGLNGVDSETIGVGYLISKNEEKASWAWSKQGTKNKASFDHKTFAYTKGNSIIVCIQDDGIGCEGLLSNNANLLSTVYYHEKEGHLIKGLRGDEVIKEHLLVYEIEINSPTFPYLTPKFKQILLNNYRILKEIDK